MVKSWDDLGEDVLAYIHECCAETGHGRFEVASEPCKAGVRIKLVATPSRKYEFCSSVMADADRQLAGRDRGLARSVEDVRDRILKNVCVIWRQAKGNGSVQVELREQQNGRVRFMIEHSCVDEVVLRPEEIQITLPKQPAAG